MGSERTPTPNPGAAGWKAPRGISPAPGSASWVAPADGLSPAPGSPAWKAPSGGKPAASAGSTAGGVPVPGGSAWTRSLDEATRKRMGTGKAGIAIACALAALIAVYGVGTVQTGNDLRRSTWYSFDDGVRLSLDFSERSIDYDASTDITIFGMTTDYTLDVATIGYQVIAPGIIRTDGGRVITVSIADDTLTFTPALTSTRGSEVWVR